MVDVRYRGDSRGAWQVSAAPRRRDSIFDDEREPHGERGMVGRRDERAERGGRHGEASRGGDALYRDWRERQVAEFDRDYEDYCRERQQQFHQDFEQWRQNRERAGKSSGLTRAKPTTERPGIEHETADTNVTTGAGQPPAQAGSGSRSGRRRT